MGVYIKGMEMPKNCLSCPLQGGTADCRLTQKTYNWGLMERPSDCPLVPVPPHGDLIDRDELMENKEVISYKDEWHMTTSGAFVCVDNIVCAPTIIPAEEAEA